MQTYENALQPGAVLGGQYRIEAVLGEGGFGITYRAHDEKLDCTVAIKEFMPAELAARAGDSITVQARTNRTEDYHFGIQRFIDEARTLAKFRHPHIVHVNNFLEDNGTAYIIMDFEEGMPLNEWLKQHDNLDEASILNIITPILDGLAAVHKTGLLHRDIKPGNIFMRDQGGPMLIDFGSARQALGEHSKSISAIISQGYAPPEQYTTRGKQGPYTDLYAVGAVMYRLITGQTPIESVDRSHDIHEGEPDPLTPAVEAGKGRVSDWLLRLTDQLLCISPKQRPQSVDEVLEAIAHKRIVTETDRGPARATGDSGKTRVVSSSERFGGGKKTDVKSRPVSSGASAKSGKSGLIVAMVLLLAVAAGGGWWYSQKGVPGTDESVVPAASSRQPVNVLNGQAILIVDSDPSDAEIYLDDVMLGRTPYRNDGITAGKHELKVLHPDSEELAIEVSLTDNEISKHDFKLKPATGNVSLFSQPDGARIEIDGKDTGKTTPATIKKLTVGEHELVLRKDAYYPKKGSLSIARNKTVRAEFTLEGGDLVFYQGEWMKPGKRDQLEAAARKVREEQARKEQAKREAALKKRKELARKKKLEQERQARLEKQRRQAEAEAKLQAERQRSAKKRQLSSAVSQAGPLDLIESKIKNNDFSSSVILKAPDIAENGAVVPVSGWLSGNQASSRFFILSDATRNRVVMEVNNKGGLDAYLSARIKLKATGNVYLAFVSDTGEVFVAKKHVKVTIGGMARKTSGTQDISVAKIKVRVRKGTIKMLFMHPMSPNDYLRSLKIKNGGRTVASIRLTPSISKNPYISLKGVKGGNLELEVENAAGNTAVKSI